MAKISVRKGMPSVRLDKNEFRKRFLAKFYDPDFEPLAKQLADVAEAAWIIYDEYHKSPRTRKAGKEFTNPDFDAPIEWLETRANIHAAERLHKNKNSPARILIVNGSSRNDQTCPGEISKTWRIVTLARQTIEKMRRFEVEILDLSRLTAEYGKVIYPCKACVSTAQPLCHWPCSCYPNHALGQAGDWMAEIYPKWVAAHGVMIVCPVNWYQAPSSLKLMIDRLVCADGGNPDITSTNGKDPAKAKQLELAGWPYPRHLAGRVFSVVVHGDAAGTENLRRILTDWLTDIGMLSSGHLALIDRYIGYLTPYATSHDDLDQDRDFQNDVRNAARALAQAVNDRRSGKLEPPDRGLHEARPK
ncbi:MAG TPA: flavodoxin family protein [Pseudolabrys sp.]|nr:flavodoxin family protein [Pseudolabrys sp.]